MRRARTTRRSWHRCDGQAQPEPGVGRQEARGAGPALRPTSTSACRARMADFETPKAGPGGHVHSRKPTVSYGKLVPAAWEAEGLPHGGVFITIRVPLAHPERPGCLPHAPRHFRADWSHNRTGGQAILMRL